MQKPDAALERLAAINRAGRGHLSPYRWMSRRHDAFAAMIDEKPPDWQALAQGFAELGMTTPDGKPLSSETLRNAWWRVRRDVAKERAKRVEPGARVAVEQPAAPVAAPKVEPPKPAKPDDDSDPMAALRRVRSQMLERSGRKE